ncbi:MAG: fructosamine kinase family protein [Saprospiraceae bacterium]|nr:fructosamine kinase family protein [Saprospiraceae bacterium]
MNQELKSLLEAKLGHIHEFQPVGGGDISKAYCLNTSFGRYFLKINETPEALNMFLIEKVGLETIVGAGSIKTPQVHLVDRWKNHAFLAMDFIESKNPTQKDFQQLGVQLAHLHQVRQTSYGGEQDNFISTLQQSNSLHDDWPAFYVFERLHPQIQLAQSQGLLFPGDIPEVERMEQICAMYLKADYPSLIHGDLWAGNFLIGIDGTPYLIDPATYYGHSLVDIAMSKLFGGFDPAFYDAYYKESSCPLITETQTDLYQLYYLLVHLNLFGPSYYRGVKKILDCHF